MDQVQLKKLNPTEKNPVKIINKLNLRIYTCIGITEELIKCADRFILKDCLKNYAILDPSFEAIEE